MVEVSDEKTLAKAIEAGESAIQVEGSLATQTIRIKAVGPVAWIVAFAALGFAVAAALTAPATLGTSGIASLAGMGVAATALGGIGVATTAVAIGVAAGGVGVLSKLRDYKLEKISDSKVILRKK